MGYMKLEFICIMTGIIMIIASFVIGEEFCKPVSCGINCTICAGFGAEPFTAIMGAIILLATAAYSFNEKGRI